MKTSYQTLFNKTTHAALAVSIAAFALTGTAFASPTTNALLEKLQKTYPNIPFSQVNETPAAGIYEAVFGKDMLYVESSGTYFFPTMVNMVTKTNLGEERRAVLNKVDIKDLPLQDAVKVVNGNGKRKLIVFADPNCGFCKKLETELAQIPDVTIHTFVLGILGQESIKTAQTINSAKDRTKVWKAIMHEGSKPSVTITSAGTEMTQRNLELFKNNGFQGTPAIIFPSGMNAKGYINAQEIERRLSQP